MRYLAVVVIWLVLSALWGIVGVLFGPGIVMLIIAMMVGTLGSLVTVLGLLGGYHVHALRAGALIAGASTFLIWLTIVNSAMTWPAAAFLAAFIAVPSFAASFLVRLVRCRASSVPASSVPDVS